MRVKIIKNLPLYPNCSDINYLIGKEFEAIDNINGTISIKYEGNFMDIYEGEYEIIG